MTKKSFPPAAFSHQGVDFRMCYTYPAADKHKDMPCRGRINPLDPMTGKCLTKRQLYGKDSDAPVNHIVHGKDPWDVYSKREAEASYLISVMVQRGLLSGVVVSDPDEDADLAELARNYKQTLFDIHPRWMKSTVQKYSSQYDIMVDELAGLRAGDLDDAAYKQLQEKICRNAARDATKHNTWEYGEIPPSSARTRLFLLYELIRCLKAEGVSIPVAPFPYYGKPSRQMLLLDRTDHARMIPDAILRAICADPVIQGQAEILADAGLRIAECTGLLFDSLRWLDTSQGRMYYLDISGQVGDDGKRTELPKTKDSYRVVPLSRELGEVLAHRRHEMETKYGDLSLRLMCGQPCEDEFDDSPAKAAAWESQVRAQISTLLRKPSAFQAIAANRVYLFDKRAQDAELYSQLVAHSLRRNFCTGAYCSSGLNSSKIHRRMGHAYKSLPPQKATGLTPTELRLMCLEKHVSHTLYHSANPLRYDAGGPFQATEVPACCVELTLMPGESVELTVEDTEPGTVTRISGEGLIIQQLRRDERRNVTYDYGLLSSEETTAVVKKRKLLG